MVNNTAYGNQITVAKKSTNSRKLSVYSNLSHTRKAKKDAEARKRAQYLASLPKQPVKRFLYRMHPKRLAAYWFSKRGALMALKIFGIFLLVMCLLVGGLFAYFRKDLDSINPDQLAKSVQTTVTTYKDSTGKVLWQDTGTGNYKLVVPSNDLSQYLKDATVSIEDKNFYKEGGVSPSGLIRASLNNIGGGSTQGASTLTQQLVKQVFFASQAGNRGLAGIPRKIKEVILSIEVDRMYSKDQILSLYLNESPYGGRRNGAESGAQTYFGVAAKDLTLPEAALLAAIPQDPTYFNPYNVAGNADLVSRQHTVLDDMAQQGYITKQQATDAKNYPIMDHIVQESNSYGSNDLAPAFVQMVRSQLESELGTAVVGQGGLTVVTTLNLDIQNKLQEAMDTMFASSRPITAGFDNGAATVEDTKTGQIVAMVGSRSYDYPGYGQNNAALSYLQPGSTIKPFVYAQLFQQKATGSPNYGSGSLLADENIDSLYGAHLEDADRKYEGNITIRSALATSRNIPAVEAEYINGVKPTLAAIHADGGTSYCTQGGDTTVGLASAIGGCGITQLDLTNAYATLARMGVYKPQSDILSVTNSSGSVLKKWSDTTGKQVIDPQSAYITADILHDDNARRPLDGYHAVGMYIPNVPTATKTGTSDIGGNAKDIWMASYSPVLTMTVWLGNADASILKQGTSSMSGPIINTVMSYAHLTVYQGLGKWKPNDWYTQPAGIQKVGSELYPSWWNKSQGGTTSKMTFDSVSKKLATSCTPTGAQQSLDVTTTTDPITKKQVITAPTGYDASSSDNVHSCSDTQPNVSVSADNSGKITVSVTQGTFPLSTIAIGVNGSNVTNITPNASQTTYTYQYSPTTTNTVPLTATVTDTGLYSATATSSIKQ